MKSIWSKGIEMPHFESLNEKLEVEAVVIGGGMAGLLTAYRLKEKGVDAVILEASEVCSGQTKNTTAKITAQHGLIYDRLITAFGEEKAAQYARANLKAIDEYERIIDKERIKCSFERLPSYLYTCSDVKAIENEYEAAQKLGIPSGVTEDISLPFKIQKALRFEKQAQFNPLEFACTIAKKLKIYENTVAVHDGNGGISANGKAVKAKHIVVASHYPFIDSAGFYFLRMHQARSYAMAFKGCGDAGGMYYGIDPKTLSFRNYGDLLIASGGSHRTGESKGDEFERIESNVKSLFPRAEEVARWSAQDCMPPDSVPYIGRYSKKFGNVYVASGFQKWGMTTSMVAADIISDMICRKENGNAEIFSPQRGNSAASGELLSNGAHSVDGLMLKKLKSPSKTASQLKNGEGDIVNYNGKTAAVYMDENGAFHAVSPNCTHLGCRLSFNPDLKSWDCPCHGSRFDVDGRVMDNPALKNLEKY